MKKVYYILSLVTLFFVAGCSSDLDETEVKGGIAGTVSDATTGEPVPTVKVTLSPGGKSTVTGTDGSFSFMNLDPDAYTVTLTKEGYTKATSTLNVKAGNATPAHLLIERIPSVVTADRETLDFGENQSTNTMSFNIVNRSYEDLAWFIEERCDWIVEVKPDEGVLKYGKTEGIVVVIDRELLSAGENKSSIVIRSSNGSSQLTVTATGADYKLPSLNTLDVTDITSSSATFNGEIIEAGIPSYNERGFVYSLSPNPTVESTISKLTSTLTSSKTFSFNAKELEPFMTYYVRAYAKNNKGIVYSSNEVKFTTTFTNPDVLTLAVSDADIDNGTATFIGEVTNIGIPTYTERGFVYSTFQNPTVNDNKVVANGSGELGMYSKYVSGLPKTTYYMRAFVTSPFGTIYGDIKIVSSEWVEISSAGIAVQRADIGLGRRSEVEQMCQESIVGGYKDWRLPNKNELMVMYNNRQKIGGFKADGYWTNDYNWITFTSTCINFSNGEMFSVDERDGDKYRGRAVRSL